MDKSEESRLAYIKAGEELKQLRQDYIRAYWKMREAEAAYMARLVDQDNSPELEAAWAQSRQTLKSLGDQLLFLWADTGFRWGDL